MAPTLSSVQRAAKLTGLSQQNVEIIASVVTIVGVFVIVGLLYFFCRKPMANMKEKCCNRGGGDEDDDGEETTFCGRLCGCCRRNDDDDDGEL